MSIRALPAHFLRTATTLLFGSLWLSAPAQAATPFESCGVDLYISQGVDNTRPTTLNVVDINTPPFTLNPIASEQKAYNSIGFSPVDKYIYALRVSDARLLRIGIEGTAEDLGTVAGLPAPTANRGYNAGEIGADGYYYVKQSGVDNRIHKIDLTTRSVVQTITLTQSANAADMAWVNGLLYMVNSDGRLASVDPATGVVTRFPTVNTGMVSPNNGTVGAMFGATNGLFGALNKPGGFYQFDLETGKATRLSSAPDVSTNDGAHCATAPVQWKLDVGISKTNSAGDEPDDQSDDTYVPGSEVSYRIVVSNRGPLGVQGLKVTDALPVGIDPATVSWTCAVTQGTGNCGQASGTGVLRDEVDLEFDAVSRIPSLATYTLKFLVPLDYHANHGQLTNTARLDLPEGYADTSPGDNEATDSDPAIANVTLLKQLTSESGNAANVAEPGETLTYTLTLTNSGGTAVNDYALTDHFDANTVFVSASHGGVNASGQDILWTGLAVPASGTQVLTVQVKVADVLPAGTTQVVNVIHPTGQAPADCSASPLPATCVVTPTPSAVTLQKALSDETTKDGIAQPGETLTYTLTLTNSGGTAVSDYALTDHFDANTTFVSASHGGVNASGQDILWTGLAVPASGTQVLTVQVKVADVLPAGTTQVVNVIHPTGQAPADCAASPLPATCVVTPTPSLVTLQKALSDESTKDGIAQPGETLTYTLTLTNSGGTAVNDYALTDHFDANTVFVSASHGGVNASGEDILWTGLAVPASGTQVLTVQVEVKDTLPAGTTQVVNVIHPTGQAPADCSASPLPSTCVVTPTPSLVTLQKALSDETTKDGIAQPGETLTYTLTLTNSGGTAVSDYALTDHFDANTTFVSASHGGVNAAGQDILWTGLAVPASGTQVLTVQVKVKDSLPAGTTQVVNVIHPTGQAPADCSASPLPSTCVVTPTPSLVTLQKALTSESGKSANVAEPGETLTYTLTLTNSGGTAVSDYALTDHFDANTTFVSASHGGVNASGQDILWTGLAVPASGTQTLTVQVKVADVLPANTTQVVNVIHPTGQTPADCSASPLPSTCVVTPTPSLVTLQKALSDESTKDGIAQPGETLTYTLTLTNSGGTAVNDYALTDHFDANTTFVSASHGGMNASGQDILWTGLSVPASGTQVLTVQVKVKDTLPANTTQVVNVIHPTGQAPADCSASPLPSTCVVTPTPSLVTLQKVLSDETTKDGIAQPGETLTYTLTLTNSGGTAVNDYALTDHFDANTGFVSASHGGVNASGQDILWTGLAVPASGTQVLTVEVKVADVLPAGTTQVVNVIHPTGQAPADCSASPLPSTCVVTPTDPARVTVSKKLTGESGSVEGRAEPGETLTYTLTLKNAGGVAAADHAFYELLPEHTSLLSIRGEGVTFSGCVAGGKSGTCTINVAGPIAGGNGTAEVIVQLQVDRQLPAGVTQIMNMVSDNTREMPKACAIDVPSAHCVVTPLVEPEGNVAIEKTSTNRRAELGDVVSYTLKVRNNYQIALHQPRIIDRLPAGFQLVDGTVRVKGTELASLEGAPGSVLTMTLASIPAGGTVDITYRVRVGVGAMEGDGINRAHAQCQMSSDYSDCSNQAQWKIEVDGGVFSEEGVLVGEIFVDCNFNSIKDSEELGIPGVRMYLEDGTYLISDSEGKYSFAGLRATTHMLKVDATTLPTRSRLVTSSHQNAGDANSLFVDIKKGELFRADFIEGSCNHEVIEQVKARRAQGEVASVQTEAGQPALRFSSKAPPQQNPQQEGTDSANQAIEKSRHP